MSTALLQRRVRKPVIQEVGQISDVGVDNATFHVENESGSSNAEAAPLVIAAFYAKFQLSLAGAGQ
jgi:hypothetical protein